LIFQLPAESIASDNCCRFIVTLTTIYSLSLFIWCPMPQSAMPLTPAEARVLAVLVEKEKTTPDVYPLSLNSLLAGCNQKTSREPVMNLSESDVHAALEGLREREMVTDGYGASGRVLRYSHHFTHGYKVASAAVPLLTVLVLRGPQTVNELRANCDRLYAFADASSLEAYLEELAARAAGTLVRKLPRQPGAREQRWAQLLCGESALPSSQEMAGEPARANDDGSLAARMTRLEAEMLELRAELHAALSAPRHDTVDLQK
jgi:uncharacterized protein YceH (UPF0502 family)